MPALKKLYDQFKPWVELVGISLDTSKKDWVLATQKQKITWTNLSDLNDGSSGIALNLGIKYIPQKFLLDPNGILLLKNTPMAEVEEVLKKILKK